MCVRRGIWLVLKRAELQGPHGTTGQAVIFVNLLLSKKTWAADKILGIGSLQLVIKPCGWVDELPWGACCLLNLTWHFTPSCKRLLRSTCQQPKTAHQKLSPLFPRTQPSVPSAHSLPGTVSAPGKEQWVKQGHTPMEFEESGAYRIQTTHQVVLRTRKTNESKRDQRGKGCCSSGGLGKAFLPRRAPEQRLDLGEGLDGPCSYVKNVSYDHVKNAADRGDGKHKDSESGAQYVEKQGETWD